MDSLKKVLTSLDMGVIANFLPGDVSVSQHDIDSTHKTLKPSVQYTS